MRTRDEDARRRFRILPCNPSELEIIPEYLRMIPGTDGILLVVELDWVILERGSDSLSIFLAAGK